MQTLHENSVIVIDGKDLVEQIGKLIDDKLADFGTALTENKLEGNEWLKAIDFCAKNQISRTTLGRYITRQKVEVKSYSPRSKMYRWMES